MREIKFRAWFKEKMWMPENIFKEEWELASLWKNGGYIKYMQYTGLKDKNGVEIYEGDVLLSKYPHQECHGRCRFDVFWDESENGWSFMPSVISQFEMEVIGNIYENPELLGG